MSDKKTTAAPNWSAAQLAQLEGYNGDNSAEALGSLVAGKTAAAVRSKLVSLGKYKKADPVAKAAAEGKAAPVKKLAQVCAIEIMLSLPEGSLATLEKAAKGELQKLADAIIKQSERSAAERKELIEQYAATIPEGENLETITSGM